MIHCRTELRGGSLSMSFGQTSRKELDTGLHICRENMRTHYAARMLDREQAVGKNNSNTLRTAASRREDLILGCQAMG